MEGVARSEELKRDSVEAMAMIDSIVDVKLKDAERCISDEFGIMGGHDGIAWVDHPMFKQTNGYYCGPASALTAIYGMGQEDRVAGSTYDQQQATLATAMGTNTEGTVCDNMTIELNKYVVNGKRYNWYESPTKNDILWRFFDSLISDNAPILRARTHHFEYYNGYSLGHYVAVVSGTIWNEDHEKSWTVMDNNRNDDYYGLRQISLNEAYNSIYGRHLIATDCCCCHRLSNNRRCRLSWS